MLRKFRFLVSTKPNPLRAAVRSPDRARFLGASPVLLTHPAGCGSGAGGRPGTLLSYEHGPGRSRVPSCRVTPSDRRHIATAPSPRGGSAPFETLLGDGSPHLQAKVTAPLPLLLILVWSEPVYERPPRVNKASDSKGVFQTTVCKYLRVRRVEEKASPVPRRQIPGAALGISVCFQPGRTKPFQVSSSRFVWLPLESSFRFVTHE